MYLTYIYKCIQLYIIRSNSLPEDVQLQHLEYSAIGAPLFNTVQKMIAQWEYLSVCQHVSLRNCSARVFTVWYYSCLYGCETWSLTVREERRLKAFGKRVLRSTFGSKSDKIRGEWRRLHNEELNDLYSSPNIIQVIKSRRMRWVGHVACMGQRGDAYRILVGKPEEKRHLKDPGLNGRIIVK